MTVRRLIKSKPNASEAHRIELTSSSTNSPSSMCALHHIRQSIADHLAPFVLSTDRNIIPNTRDIFVKYAKFAKSVLQRAAFVCSSLEVGGTRIEQEGTSKKPGSNPRLPLSRCPLVDRLPRIRA